MDVEEVNNIRFLERLEVNNYLNIKHAKLAGLKDLNIIIGPNNCGKTSILRAINSLGNLTFKADASLVPQYACSLCVDIAKKLRKPDNLQGQINLREKYLTKGKVKLIIGYDRAGVELLLPELTKRGNAISTAHSLREELKKHLKDLFQKEQITLTEKHNQNISESLGLG